MKKTKWNIMLNIAIGILCLLLFIIPFYSAYQPAGDYNDPKNWPDVYIIDSFEVIFLIPLIVILLMCFFLPMKNKLKKTLKFVALGFSGLLGFASILYLITPIQDLNAGYGSLIPIIIFPVLLTELLYDIKLNQKMDKDDLT